MNITLNTIYNEPCMDTLARMADGSVDCVITSPPYWQLRDYGYPGQWGLEPTFEEYLNNLWRMMGEIWRVLKPTGTVWINIGDTYGTQSGNMRNPRDSKEKRHAGEGIHFIQPKSVHKSLLLLPHRFAIGCMERGWIIRNDVIWAKSNGMPESVTDRFSKKHEYIFFMVKQEKYYFNLDAVRDKHKAVSLARYERGNSAGNKYGNGDGAIIGGIHNLSKPRLNAKFGGKKGDGFDHDTIYSGNDWTPRLDGKNPGSVSDFWDISTKSNKKKHYASFNDSLLLKPVLAGCPQGGIIYDPFMGTGTTAKVAIRSGRNFIGSEMGKEYCIDANNDIELLLQQLTLV